jgi:rubrerythrin
MQKGVAMATSPGNEVELVDALKGLMELDLDAIAAYKTAIERLDDPSYRIVMREFLFDHQRHVRELGPAIAAMGETPPEGADGASTKGLLTRGRVVIGQLIGDAGILAAMRSNEEETSLAYAQAAERGDLSPKVRELLARALADEQRHRAWLEGTLARLQDPEPLRDAISQPYAL